MNKNRVWIYCRVAHEDGIALEMQKEGLLRAVGNDSEIVGITTEIGNGLSLDRPSLNEVYQMAAEGRMDSLIVRSISRIGRDVGDTLAWIQNFVKSGVSINFLNEGIIHLETPDNPTNQLSM